MTFKLTRPRFGREYFLFLLPAFFVLHGYVENEQLVPAWTCLALFIRYVVAALLLCAVFFVLMKSWRKGAVFTMLLLAFHFFFGSLHDAAKSIFGNSILIKYSFLLPFVLVVFLALFFYFRKTGRTFQRLVTYANLLLVILVCIDAIQLVLYNAHKSSQPAALTNGLKSCDSCATPDVFFIVADGYAGRQELRDVFHFDNSAFENGLSARGFHIIDSSESNYNYTPFSTASILSMNYLQGIEGRNRSKADRHICYGLINKNPVIDFFKTSGYAIHNFSVFKLDGKLPPARSSFILTGEDLLTAQTFLSRLNRDIRFNLVTRYNFVSEIKRMNGKELNSVEALYNGTMEVAAGKDNQPRFVYTHLMMPHYPYFFDSAGRAAPLEQLTDEMHRNKEKYIGYLQYANKKYLALIDHIIAHAQQPPVIVFMSDHGFREFEPDTVAHRYHFMNMNAVYLPQGKYDGFYKGMSAVNEFRVILNEAFGQRLPLLKDSTSYLTE